MRFARLAASAALAVSVVTTTPSIAAPVTVGTYYDETVSASCAPATTCPVWFSQTPSDMLLLVQKVHCDVIGQPNIIAVARLMIATTKGGTALQRVLPLPLVSLTAGTAVSGSYFESIDTDAQWLIGQGRFPFVQLNASATNSYVSGVCTISGQLIAPP
ncbi:hypothetical protein RAD16_06640 [Bradyrhizobium sp. 18BD]